MDADEDEFGDLYTDVLRPAPSASIPPLLSSSNPSPDINSSSDEEDIILYGKNPSSFSAPSYDAPRDRPKPSSPTLEEPARVSIALISDPVQESGTRAPDAEKAGVLTEEEMGIVVGIGDLDSDQPEIPGLSTSAFVPGVFVGSAEDGAGLKPKDVGNDEDDWESDDSEDDLQIVLNETHGPMGVERDEDEDGEDLVIVADGDQHLPGIEEQEWGEEAGQTTLDGERKEGGEMPKGSSGGVAVTGPGGARIGYSSHGFHPHHSQFKYVRPGATIVSGNATGGGAAPGPARPPSIMGSIAGRGRGDWRSVGINKNVPTMQKNFHGGFGLPVWANNSSGRAFGTGMEFTLPSHKTVFDIDIDSFEEKPWRYPGVDTSDYFNFGLDEENWKDYCKQLGQLRLEATMQSKIRVYESGRSEQDYDPDLPPELAAAAGLHDVAAESSHLGKIESGPTDLAGQGRGAIRTRPPLPTGRAIQVEGGYGERLPSIDTRPPRVRDSDAIIEIVLQDSVDDDSITTNGEQPEDGAQIDLKEGGHDFEDDDRQANAEYFEQFPPAYNGRKGEVVTRRAPFASSIQSNTHEGDGILPFPSGVPLQCRPSSNVQAPIYPGPFNTPHGGRRAQGAGHERYTHVSTENANEVVPNQSARIRSDVHLNEKSRASIEDNQVSEALSPVAEEAGREQSIEQKDNLHDDGHTLADSIEGEEMASDLGGDDSMHLSFEKRKLSSRVEQPAAEDVASADDLRTSHSDDSKAKSGSSRDCQKRRDGGDEEVAQDARSKRMGEGKRYRDEDEISYRRRDEYNRDSKEIDRNRMVVKGREDLYHSYPHKDWDSSSAHYNRAKTESIERPKERESSGAFYQKRDEDTHGRRVKDEELRRRDRIEDIGSRHRSKLRESERIDRDEHLHSRRRVDDGEWRGSHDKDTGQRQRERDDVLMGRHEIMDDPHVRRRKDEELHRREHVDKEDILHGYRTREDTSRRKRERDDGLDHRRREDYARGRDKVDDHHSFRHREDSWRVREREDRLRPKQTHEDTHAIRDREEGRSSLRSGRLSEDKQWVVNSRAKDEPKGLSSDRDYQHKDKRREIEQPKRRDRVEEDTSSHHRVHDETYARENQLKEDRNTRQDRSSTQNDRPINASYSQRISKDRHKENLRKSKEPEGVEQNSQVLGRHKHDDHSAHRNEKVGTKGINEQESGTQGHSNSRDHGQPRPSSVVLSKKGHHHLQHEHYGASQQRHSSRKHGEDADSDEEQQQNSRRGRSKLERWTSHKEREGIINVHSPPPSSKGRETGRSVDKSLARRQPDEVAKKGADVDALDPSVGLENASVLEPKNADMLATSDDQHVDSERVGDDRHLDTVEKLKKRSERFKLPMPSEKDTSTNRKVENNETLLPQTENNAAAAAAADAEIKQERPARKRRWNYKDLE